MAELEFQVADGDSLNPQVLALINDLDAFSSSLYPPESNHFDPPQALCDPDVCFLVATIGGEAVGCGALKRCGNWGEIKRMYLKPAARGRGIASTMLSMLLERARRQGLSIVRLETGPLNPGALKLYRAFGFEETKAFPPYQPDPLSVFMEIKL